MGKYALIIVSALIFSILTYSSGLRNAMFTSNVRVVETFSENQAQGIAQSVMMSVLSEIKENGEVSMFIPEDGSQFQYPSAGFEAWNDIRGSYSIQSSRSGETIQIVTTGLFEEIQSRARAELIEIEPIWNPNFTSAVHSDGSISLGGSSKIIGHASTNSTALGTVNLAPSTRIDSTLYIGPGGNPDGVVNQQNNSGNVGEGVETMAKEKEYPMPEFPDYPVKDIYGTSVYVGGSTNQTLSVSEYDGLYIPEIRIESGTQLTIDLANGDRILHVGSLDIIQGHLHVAGAGKLTVYVENSFKLEGSSTVNNSGETDYMFTYYGGIAPLHFAGSTIYNAGLFAESADITIIGSSSLRGHLITGGSDVYLFGDANANSRVIYAPNAHVEMAGSSFVHGAVVSKSFEARGTAEVKFNPAYDSDLPDLMLNQEIMYQIVFWN